VSYKTNKANSGEAQHRPVHNATDAAGLPPIHHEVKSIAAVSGGRPGFEKRA
jgi:hypothetical protein